MDELGIQAAIEAILYVCGDPIGLDRLADALARSVADIEAAVDGLRDRYGREGRGLEIQRFGNEVRISARAEYAPIIERCLQPPTRKAFTQTIIETLSIVAYKQPITKAEIEEIRGVKCDYSVQILMAKGMIREAGRREGLGRPIEYATTDAFLRHVGIEGLRDLPERLEGGESGRAPGDPDLLDAVGEGIE